jgi:hypothetical protein
LGRKQKITIAVVALAVLVVLASVYALLAAKMKPADPFYPKASEKSTSATASPVPSASSSGGTTLNPGHTDIQKTSQPQVSESGGVVITSPTQGSVVSSGTTVSGQAKVASSMVHYRLKGGKSGQLASGEAQITPSSSALEPYSFTLLFTNQVTDSPDQGALEVFTLSPSGTETNLASVTVDIQ